MCIRDRKRGVSPAHRTSFFLSSSPTKHLLVLDKGNKDHSHRTAGDITTRKIGLRPKHSNPISGSAPDASLRGHDPGSTGAFKDPFRGTSHLEKLGAMICVFLHHRRKRKRGHPALVQNHHHRVRPSNSFRVERRISTSAKGIHCRG